MAWRTDGMRHDQLLLILDVPNDDQDALGGARSAPCEEAREWQVTYMMLPEYQRVL